MHLSAATCPVIVHGVNAGDTPHARDIARLFHKGAIINVDQHLTQFGQVFSVGADSLLLTEDYAYAEELAERYQGQLIGLDLVLRVLGKEHGCSCV